MIKEPKKYECLHCGFKSSRSKTLTIGPVGFARCFKCKGRVKEREEWLEWYRNSYDEWRKGLPKALDSTAILSAAEAARILRGAYPAPSL